MTDATAGAVLELRTAHPDDLDELEELEFDSFDGDRFNRRQLRYLLSRARAVTVVIEDVAGTCAPPQRILAYGTLLLRSNSHRARLYSLCVHPAVRGSGQGRRLLVELERRALEHGASELVLEVRADNRRALGLYRRMGYRTLHWIDEYYSDGCAAWRMSKPLPAPLD